MDNSSGALKQRRVGLVVLVYIQVVVQFIGSNCSSNMICSCGTGVVVCHCHGMGGIGVLGDGDNVG